MKPKQNNVLIGILTSLTRNGAQQSLDNLHWRHKLPQRKNSLLSGFLKSVQSVFEGCARSVSLHGIRRAGFELLLNPH